MEQTEEQKERIAKFLKGYGALVKEFEVDMANYPVWVPEANGSFKTIIQSTPVDIKGRGTLSPFIPNA